MKLRIVAVGSLKPRAARVLCDDYLARLRHYCRCDEIEVPPAASDKLAHALRRACGGGASVVALCVGGQALSSRQLASQIERLGSQGKGEIALLVGGADGLPREIEEQATARWSLSPLTFPHRLARVILAEQLYRAMTILRSEPYDR